MGNFHDLVNKMKEPGEDGVPDTIYDDLTAEYDNAFQGYNESTKQKDSELESLRGEVSRLKASNYDLLTQVSTTDPVDPSDGSGVSSSDANDEITIEGLFQKRN